MAYANVEQAALIQRLLAELGLVGPRLAESRGTEDGLAVQVVERLGLEYEDWHVEYIRALVGSACQLADLERMQGSEEAESLQRIRDARAFSEVAMVQLGQRRQRRAVSWFYHRGGRWGRASG